MIGKKEVTVSLRIEPHLDKIMEDFCTNHKITKSKLTRRAIQSYISNHTRGYLSDVKKKFQNDPESEQIQFDEEILQRLQQIAAKYHLPQNFITRESINLYLNEYRSKNPEVNPKLTISHNIFRKAITIASEKDLEEMAAISFQNGLEYKKHLFQKLDLQEGKINSREAIDFALKILYRDVFAPEAQNWFNKIEYSWKKAQIMIAGKHDLGKNFSLFMKILMQKYMGLFFYELAKNVIRDDTVILTYNPLMK